MVMRVGDPAINALTERIIGACIEVHRELGPGLLESAYEECVCHLLSVANMPYERQVSIPVQFRGIRLDCGYRLDIVVAHTAVVELKSIERILPVHEAHVLTYLKLSQNPVGLLVNFKVPVLKAGIRRIINQPQRATSAPPRLRASDDVASSIR
jgi:GxxExxY protein